MVKHTILVADDDAAIRTVLNQALTRAGFEVRITSNITKLWQWIESGEGDLVISDVIMPDGDIFELLPKIKQKRENLPVIVISAQNTFMTAVKAEEAGAREYLPKPFDLDVLLDSVKLIIDEPTNIKKAQRADEYTKAMPLVGRSEVMQDIYQLLTRLFHTDVCVTISGDNGTGKRLKAKIIHDYGDRKHGPFIEANLAVMASDDMEAELFGQLTPNDTKRTGLIQQADGGTLYLNDIGCLSRMAQTKLMRLLTQNEIVAVGSNTPTKVDVRVIVSSAKPLLTLVEEGILNSVLVQHLDGVNVDVPELYERREDIPDLARHFLKLGEIQGNQPRHLNEKSLTVLKNHQWLGNVRQLENFVHRLCILYPHENLTLSMVKTELKKLDTPLTQTNLANETAFDDLSQATDHFVSSYFEEYSETLPPNGLYQKFLEEFEAPLISRALTATNGNQIKAAKLLGINRNTLRTKINAHNITITRVAK